VLFPLLGLDEDQTVAEYRKPPRRLRLRVPIAVREDEPAKMKNMFGGWSRAPTVLSPRTMGLVPAALLLIGSTLGLDRQRGSARAGLPSGADYRGTSPPPQLSNDASGKTADPNPAVAGPSAAKPVAQSRRLRRVPIRNARSRPPDSRLKIRPYDRDPASLRHHPRPRRIRVSITVTQGDSSEVVARVVSAAFRTEECREGGKPAAWISSLTERVDTGAKYGEARR